MASPGTFLSTVGHCGLIGWLIIGWGFQSEPLQMETMDVSVISGEEFDQMTAGSTPEPGDADPTAPVPPVIEEVPPPVPAQDDPAEIALPPEPVAVPDDEVAPPAPPPLIVSDLADQRPQPPALPQTPPPIPDVAANDTPTPPQAPTVTSTITAPPPPDANVDDIVREEVVPDDSAEVEAVQEEQTPTAPEETTDRVVIEDLAPSTSIRPSARPSRPAPPQTETASAEPASPPAETDTSSDDVTAALEDAVSETDAPAVPVGPPMTGAERDSFRIAVNRCWNVDPGSVAARVTVEVGFNLSSDGTVVGDEVRLLSSDGDQSATNTAFEAARRAILRCQSGGYDLPADKYDQWKEVIITFDPSGMRLR